MATNIEIEAKVLIDEKGYKAIKDKYEEYSKNAYLQTNYYIDTPDFYLRKNGMSLRIREFSNSYEMTLKTPLSEGLLEKTEEITKNAYLDMKKNNILPNGKIKQFVISLGIDPEMLKIQATLQTERVDIDFESGVFSIDKNSYSGKVDYELEKESNNLKDAEEFLANICKEVGIPYNINKISKQARAFSALKKED